MANGTVPAGQKPTSIQIIAVLSAAIIGFTLAFAVTFCAINKTYIDAPMLMLIGTVLGGISGALTTILVGRSLSQLNHPEDTQTTVEQTTKTVTTPKPSSDVPMVITKQPEVAIAGAPPVQDQ